MDSAKVQEASTISICEEMSARGKLTKGILKRSSTTLVKTNNQSPDRSPAKKSPTIPIRRVIKVSFPDRAKNQPIATIFEVEPIIYEDFADSPKGSSCVCLLF